MGAEKRSFQETPRSTPSPKTSEVPLPGYRLKVSFPFLWPHPPREHQKQGPVTQIKSRAPSSLDFSMCKMRAHLRGSCQPRHPASLAGSSLCSGPLCKLRCEPGRRQVTWRGPEEPG